MRSEVDERKIVENFKLRQELQHVPHTLPVKSKADIVLDVEAGPTDDGFKYSYTIEDNAQSE